MSHDNENDMHTARIIPAVDAMPPHTPTPDCSSDQLEAASQRVLLYLKALRVPVHKRHALAGEALRRAAALPDAEGGMAAAAMRCCMHLLQTAPDAGCARGVDQPAEFFSDQLSSVQSMPPLNRSSMIPLELERTGPISFFLRLFAEVSSAPLRAPLRLYLLIGVCAALAAYYAWRGPGW